MKHYLLDTHILVWWLFEDKKLSLKIKAIIENPESVLFVSAATIWEIVIKKASKKLQAPDNIQELLDDYNITVLPITIDHALYVGQLPPIHHDPFDRMLIAQALVEDLIIVTQDSQINQYDARCF